MQRLVSWIIERAVCAAPYFHIDDYMRRYWLLGADSAVRNIDNPNWRAEYARPRSRFYHWLTQRIAIRLHQILRSDDKNHMHDHPCWNVSIILRGGYYELVPVRRAAGPWTVEEIDAGEEDYIVHWRGPGNIVFRRATDRHRIIMPVDGPCWSVLILGRKSNSWGFYTPFGKLGWREYLGIPENDNRERETEAA